MRSIKFATLIVAVHLFAATLAWSTGASFVGTSTPIGGASVLTTGAISITPTTGHWIGVYLSTNGTATGVGCTDSGSVSLSAGPTYVGSNPFIYSFFEVAPAGVTSITCSWSTNARNFSAVPFEVIAGGINFLNSGITANGSSTTASISPTASQYNDLVVSACSVNANRTYSSGTGNLRTSGPASGSPTMALVTNTSGSSTGSGVTTSTGFSGGSALWSCASLEFLPVSATITSSYATPINGGSATSTGNLSWSPTAGHIIVACLVVENTISGVSCLDNNSNALTLRQGPGGFSGGPEVTEFTGTAVSGASSYHCTWTGAGTWALTLGEFTSVNSVVVPTLGTSSGSTSPMIASPASQSAASVANDLMVGCGGIAGTNALTINTGYLRSNLASSNSTVAMIDGTSDANASANFAFAAAGTGSNKWGISTVELTPTTASNTPKVSGPRIF